MQHDQARERFQEKSSRLEALLDAEWAWGIEKEALVAHLDDDKSIKAQTLQDNEGMEQMLPSSEVLRMLIL